MKLYYTVCEDGDGYLQLDIVSSNIDDLKRAAEELYGTKYLKDVPIYYTTSNVLFIDEDNQNCYEGIVRGAKYKANGKIYENIDDVYEENDGYTKKYESVEYYKDGRLIKTDWEVY